MDTVERVTRNTIAISAANLGTQIIAALTGILVARYLGTINYGYYATALAFTGIFAVFCDLGMNTGLIWTGSRDTGARQTFFGNVLMLKTFLAALTYGLIIVIAWIIDYTEVTRFLIAIFGFVVLLQAFQGTFSSLFQTLQRMEFITLFRILTSSLNILLILIVLKLDLGIKYIAYAVLTATAISSLLWANTSFSYLKPSVDISRVTMVIKNSYLFSLAGIFYIIYFRVDTVLLSIMKPASDVGIYSAAYKLVAFFLIVPRILTQVLNPVAFKYGVEDINKLKYLYRKIYRYSAFSAIPIFVILILFADKIIIYLYGMEYKESITILRILSWFILFRFVGDFAGSVLDSINKVHLSVTAQGITMGVNVLLNLVLIPPYGPVGAALSTVVSESALTLLYFLFVSELFYKLSFLKESLKLIVAGIFMALLIFYVLEPLPFFLAIVISSLIYVIMTYKLRFFPQEDIDLFKTALSKLAYKAGR